MRKCLRVVAAGAAGILLAATGLSESAVAGSVSNTIAVYATTSTPTQIASVDQFDTLTLTATGTTAFCANAPGCFNVGPNGVAFPCGAAGSCPADSTLVGSLVYKVGVNGAWQLAGSGPVTISSSSLTPVPVFVVYNDVFGQYDDNAGYYYVTATVQTVPGCTGPIISGTHGSITVGAGTVTCVQNATITGGITVARGGQLFIVDSTVKGSIAATAPGALSVCGSTTGSISVSGATGLVRVGDPASDCGANTINGGLTVANNTAGVIVVGNTITGSWTVTHNSGSPVTVSGNHH